MGDALEARLLLLQAQLDEARAIRELELARADLATAVGEDPLAASIAVRQRRHRLVSPTARADPGRYTGRRAGRPGRISPETNVKPTTLNTDD